MENLYKTKEEWNSEYATGNWEILGCSLEKNRHAVISMYCNHFFPAGKILDVGCGECVLYDLLNPSQQKQYYGIDLSEEAINIARKKRNVRADAIDAGLFESSEKFDVIVLNEVLIFLDYTTVFKKYADFLTDNGLLIVSISKGDGHGDLDHESKIWVAARAFFSTYENIEIKGRTDDFLWTWEVEVFKKR